MDEYQFCKDCITTEMQSVMANSVILSLISLAISMDQMRRAEWYSSVSMLITEQGTVCFFFLSPQWK